MQLKRVSTYNRMIWLPCIRRPCWLYKMFYGWLLAATTEHNALRSQRNAKSGPSRRHGSWLRCFTDREPRQQPFNLRWRNYYYMAIRNGHSKLWWYSYASNQRSLQRDGWFACLADRGAIYALCGSYKVGVGICNLYSWMSVYVCVLCAWPGADAADNVDTWGRHQCCGLGFVRGASQSPVYRLVQTNVAKATRKEWPSEHKAHTNTFRVRFTAGFGDWHSSGKKRGEWKDGRVDVRVVRWRSCCVTLTGGWERLGRAYGNGIILGGTALRNNFTREIF